MRTAAGIPPAATVAETEPLAGEAAYREERG